MKKLLSIGLVLVMIIGAFGIVSASNFSSSEHRGERRGGYFQTDIERPFEKGFCENNELTDEQKAEVLAYQEKVMKLKLEKIKELVDDNKITQEKAEEITKMLKEKLAYFKENGTMKGYENSMRIGRNKNSCNNDGEYKAYRGFRGKHTAL